MSTHLPYGALKFSSAPIYGVLTMWQALPCIDIKKDNGKIGHLLFEVGWLMAFVSSQTGVCFFLLTSMRWFRTLVLFFLGWNWRGKHWQLSLLSAPLYDSLAERSCVQCHHRGSEKVKNAVLMKDVFGCRTRDLSGREGQSLPGAPRGFLLTLRWPDSVSGPFPNYRRGTWDWTFPCPE